MKTGRGEWKRLGVAFAGFILLFLSAQMTGGFAAAVTVAPGMVESPAGDYVPGELVVGFARGSDPEKISSSLEAIDAEDTESVPGLARTRVVEIDEGDDVVVAADELDDQAGVRWAEPNYIVEGLSLPNDPRLGFLWGLRNVGQNSRFNDPWTEPLYGRPGVDIGAPSAWKKTTGSAGSIAIIDTGIDGFHPDLKANLDRRLSRNFVAAPSLAPDPVVDPHAWTDRNKHGTHVAGTVGAVGNNGLGVAGVNWRTRLVAVRVLNYKNQGTTADVAAGFAYVGSKGIPIANASLAVPVLPHVLREAIKYSPDTLFVVAAGNEGVNNDEVPSYPCNFSLSNLLCVAAINSRAGLASFSNYGKRSVDVAGPGVDVESTVPEFSHPFDADFARGLGGFEQKPYPWKLTASDGHSRLTFDGHDGNVPTPVAEATATLKEPIDLSDQRFCRLDLGYLGYALDLDLHGSQSLAVEWTVDGGPPKRLPVADAKTLKVLRDQGIYEGYGPVILPLVGGDGASDVRLALVFLANGTPSPLPSIDIGQMEVDCITSTPPGGAYDARSGTSMASPHVAGIAGLVRSVAPKAGPKKLKQIIMGSVVPTRSLKGKTVTGGRVDAGRAVRFIRPASKARLTGLKVSPKKLWLLPGRSGRLKVRVRNGGGATAKKLRICLRAPKRRIKGTGCTGARRLGSGKRTRFHLRVGPRSGVRPGRTVKLRIKARVRGAGNLHGAAWLKAVRHFRGRG